MRYYSAPQATTYWNSYKPEYPDWWSCAGSTSRDGSPGNILNSITNLHTMLTHDAAFSLWFDDFDSRRWMGTRWSMTASGCASSPAWKPRMTGRRVGRELMFSAVEYVCRQTTRNPVQAYVKGLKWDGLPRIDRWVLEVCHTENTSIGSTLASGVSG